MPLKDILVYVDDSAQAAGTVAAACSLARRHDAHLTGLAVDRPADIPGFAAIEIPPSAVEITCFRSSSSFSGGRAIRARSPRTTTGRSISSGCRELASATTFVVIGAVLITAIFFLAMMRREVAMFAILAGVIVAGILL